MTPMRTVGRISGFLCSALLAAAALVASAQPVSPPSATAVPQPMAEEISSFAAVITVGVDGGIAVSERIEYVFPSPRHGIFRDIPTRYALDDGHTVDVPVSVLGVIGADGTPVPYVVSKNRVGIRVKIGDPDRTVSGLQTYVISYAASGALRYFSDHDELYWNVTGDAWTVPIRRVSATVRLPQEVPADGPRAKCFTGPTGSTAEDCVAGVQGRTAQFASNAAPLTVVAGWAPGIVAKVEAKEVASLDALAWLPLVMPFSLAVFLFVLWRRHGRDSAGRGTLVVQYDPPPGLTPTEAGVIMDERADMKDVTATIVDLAVRGHLKIREVDASGIIFSGTDYEIDRLKPPVDAAPLKAFEHLVLGALFGQSPVTARLSDIKREYAFSKHLPGIKDAIYDGMVRDGHFPANPERVRGRYIAGGVALMAIALMLVAMASALGSLLLTAFLASVGACGLVLLVFGPFMPRRTAKGVAAHEHTAGFREYLDKAERYRIQWQEKENVFERFLPYAMAFGVAQKWAKTFEGMQLAKPEWYEGRSLSGGTFNSAALYGAIAGMNSSLASAMQSTPSKTSSGSGFSGGSSGGGFGGGGGGSW